MTTRKLYLWQNPSSGRWYVRRRGSYHPLRDDGGRPLEPNTPEGDRVYWEIMRGVRVTGARGMHALIDDYRASERFARLAPRTRRDYERVLAYLVERAGSRPVAAWRRSDVIAAQRANSHRVRFANYLPPVLSVLFEHAIDLDWRADNPAKGVRRMAMPDDRTREHVPWTDEACALMRAEGAELPRLIFELGVGSVQRPADLTRFAWDDWDGEALRIVQGKTGRALWLPATPQLVEALAEARRRTNEGGGAILRGARGGALTYRTMAQVFLAERRRLGLERHDMHALRYRGVHELAQAGCSDDEIAAFSGHMTRDMIAKYAGPARQEARARAAVKRRSR